MNPYAYVREYAKGHESMLSLGCGVGFEFDYIKLPKSVGVDIHGKYLEEVRRKHPDVHLACSDVLSYLKTCGDGTFDIISFSDVLEHLTKEEGWEVLKHCKRVAKRKVIVFTQIGYLRNEPHNAWGIEGGDEYQKHLSGWEVEELESLGYKLVAREKCISQHGEPYEAVLYLYEVQ